MEFRASEEPVVIETQQAEIENMKAILGMNTEK